MHLKEELCCECSYKSFEWDFAGADFALTCQNSSCIFQVEERERIKGPIQKKRGQE